MQRASPETLEFLKNLRELCTIGCVGGSDLTKQLEQLPDSINIFDYAFPENGLLAFKDGVEIGRTSFLNHYGEEKMNRLISFILKYLSTIELPQKRGTFIEFRNGMLNVSPIGRNCSREERNAFEAYDKEHKIRETMVAALQAEFADEDLTFSIGGQISFDLFPKGWDKT